MVMSFAVLGDARAALRGLRRRPLFPAAVVLTLAVALGANTAIFSVVHAVLLRQLPLAEAERLVAVSMREPGSDRQPFAIADFLDLRAAARGFDGLVAWGTWSANLDGSERTERLQAQWTSSGFFELLGARAALGRIPTAEEERPGAPHVVLLSDATWRGRFGGDPAILGRALLLNGEPYTVIGVMPPSFVFFTSGAELVAPLALEADPRRASRGAAFLRVVGRLGPGTSLGAARQELDGIVARLRREYPETNAGRQGVKIQPLAELIVGNHRAMLLVLAAAVALVLAIACTNLASLFLGRIGARRRELAVRTALGARRWDLARHALAETVVLALLGGLLGLFLAFGGVRVLVALAPAPLPRAAEIGLDAPVLAFSLLLSLATGLGFGLLPAIQASAAGVADSLRGVGRGSVDGGRGGRARAGLVVAEVGLALVILVAAGLMLRSLHRLQATDPGFAPDHLLSVQLSLPKARYGTPAALTRYGERLTERLAALPGVAAVGTASLNPLVAWRANVVLQLEGRPEARPEEAPLANYRAVAPGYFATLRIPLLAGRDVEPRDRADGVPVAIVSDSLARRDFPGASPLGARLRIDDRNPPRTVEIVGVVGDVKHTGLDAEGSADIYVPYAQTPQDVAVWLANIFCVAVRTSGDPKAVVPGLRREIHELDRDVAAAGVRTMEEAIAASLAQRRFNTRLLESFGVAAFLLALAGIYAVTAFSVGERRREIGVRLTLGAERRRILGLVVGQALAPVAGGMLLGAGAALALGRLLAGLLFGIAPHDAGTFAAAVAAIGLAALLASLLPALRATRIDPVEVLRGE
jgi:putative ABC transport system permease protein